MWADNARPFQGGAKASEAAVIYQELGERHNWTVPLYNGAAACAMQLGIWEEAEQYLQAHCSAKAPESRETDCLNSPHNAGCDLGEYLPGVKCGDVLGVPLM